MSLWLRWAKNLNGLSPSNICSQRGSEINLHIIVSLKFSSIIYLFVFSDECERATKVRNLRKISRHVEKHFRGKLQQTSLSADINKNELKQEKTRGPWWSYIAHLTKQICIFTVEVSAKFTALGFLYKLYSTNHPHPPPPHPWPCFFTNLDDLNWILKEGHQRNISAKLYWNWSSGLKSFI